MGIRGVHVNEVWVSWGVHTLFLSLPLSAVSNRLPGSVSTENKRERFRQQKQKELDSDVLDRTTDFVKTYLAHHDVWSFKDKDQNMLTLEVMSCDMSCDMCGYGIVRQCHVMYRTCSHPLEVLSCDVCIPLCPMTCTTLVK